MGLRRFVCEHVRGHLPSGWATENPLAGQINFGVGPCRRCGYDGWGGWWSDPRQPKPRYANGAATAAGSLHND